MRSNLSNMVDHTTFVAAVSHGLLHGFRSYVMKLGLTGGWILVAGVVLTIGLLIWGCCACCKCGCCCKKPCVHAITSIRAVICKTHVPLSPSGYGGMQRSNYKLQTTVADPCRCLAPLSSPLNAPVAPFPPACLPLTKRLFDTIFAVDALRTALLQLQIQGEHPENDWVVGDWRSRSRRVHDIWRIFCRLGAG
jgi:hypothetical protein